MRITFSIDEDILTAVKKEARRRNATMSKTANEIMRQALHDSGLILPAAATIGRFAIRPPRNEMITVEHVKMLLGQ